MARRREPYTEVLVVDVEATCWEGAPPKGEVSEIIEVGLCVLDVDTLERWGNEGLLVRPTRSRVSEFCTQLTTLTAEDVAAGASFAEVCRTLVEAHAGRQRLFASYGNYDRKIFTRQCQDEGVDYPFSADHWNIKQALCERLGWRRPVGMKKALQLLGMPLEGTHHRGRDDAWNIAALAAHLLREGLAPNFLTGEG